MDINQDKRNFPRTSVKLTASVNIGSKKMAGKILNLTVEGISLELKCRLNIGDRLTIGIDDSQRVKKNKLQAKVIRCNPLDADPSMYITVAKFIAPNDEYLMDALALVHGEKSELK